MLLVFARVTVVVRRLEVLRGFLADWAHVRIGLGDGHDGPVPHSECVQNLYAGEPSDPSTGVIGWLKRGRATSRCHINKRPAPATLMIAADVAHKDCAGTRAPAKRDQLEATDPGPSPSSHNSKSRSLRPTTGPGLGHSTKVSRVLPRGPGLDPQITVGSVGKLHGSDAWRVCSRPRHPRHPPFPLEAEV